MSVDLVGKKSIRLRSLSGKKKFAEVFERGKRLFFEHGYVIFLPTRDNRGEVHLGIITHKKLGKAVERNRARRIIRETLRVLLQEEEMRQGFAIIFVLNNVNIDSKEIREVAKEALKRISYSGNKG